MICKDCIHWTFLFETGSLYMGRCNKQNREVDGDFDAIYNECPLEINQWDD